jgi:polyphosphate kinase 2 (PPK2 family)
MNFFAQEIIQNNILQNEHKDKFTTFVHVITKECLEKFNIGIKEPLDKWKLDHKCIERRTVWHCEAAIYNNFLKLNQ